MLAGAPGDGFSESIIAQQQQGQNISYILFLNEPDQCGGGGSCLSPSHAASIWSQQILSIKSKYPSILVSAPAVTGSPRGLLWLQDYFAACAGSCQHDFLALHWYGPSDGLESWVSQMQSLVASNSTTSEIWISEFAYPFVNLTTTQSFFNASTAFLDAQPNVTRYAYFGAFRFNDSNIGPDAAMLNSDGLLTDIGSFYLDGAATGVLPNAAGGKSAAAMSTILLLLLLAGVAAVSNA